MFSERKDEIASSYFILNRGEKCLLQLTDLFVSAEETAVSSHRQETFPTLTWRLEPGTFSISFASAEKRDGLTALGSHQLNRTNISTLLLEQGVFRAFQPEHRKCKILFF